MGSESNSSSTTSTALAGASSGAASGTRSMAGISTFSSSLGRAVNELDDLPERSSVSMVASGRLRTEKTCGW